MSQQNDVMGELRSLTSQPPSRAGWDAIVAQLGALSIREVDELGDFLTRALDPWPDAYRIVATYYETEKTCDERAEWPFVRHLYLEGDDRDDLLFISERHDAFEHITEATLGFYQDETLPCLDVFENLEGFAIDTDSMLTSLDVLRSLSKLKRLAITNYTSISPVQGRYPWLDALTSLEELVLFENFFQDIRRPFQIDEVVSSSLRSSWLPHRPFITQDPDAWRSLERLTLSRANHLLDTPPSSTSSQDTLDLIGALAQRSLKALRLDFTTRRASDVGEGQIAALHEEITRLAGEDLAVEFCWKGDFERLWRDMFLDMPRP